MSLIEGLIGPIAKIIDKIIPDPEARDKAKLELLKLEGSQDMEAMRTQLSAILAEAQSADPWTSRARPTFLYVMYAVILLCLAASVAGIWWPDAVTAAAQNFANLLAAIPESLWWLFGTGYLGYTGARSFEKWRGVNR